MNLESVNIAESEREQTAVKLPWAVGARTVGRLMEVPKFAGRCILKHNEYNTKIIQWSCPIPRSPSQKENERAFALYAAIQKINKKQYISERFAGFELEIALNFLRNDSKCSKSDNFYWQAKCRTLFTRPAMEPVAYTYWDCLSRPEMNETMALQIASVLAGRKVTLRQCQIIGKSRSGNVEFETLTKANSWFTDISNKSNDPSFLLMLPAYAFVRVIMAHPFSDANGRFARFMIYAAMAQVAGVTSPSVALAPIFYRHAETLGASMQAVSNHHDWTNFYSTFFSILEEAVEVTRGYLNH